MVAVGDRVDELVHFGDERPRPMWGTVVWVHPEGRFYVAEFDFDGFKVREAYFLGERRGIKP